MTTPVRHPIRSNGYAHYNTWEHSQTIRDLYTRRCRLEEPEMDCAAQAAELLAPYVSPGDILLDVGCGSGSFYHSLVKRAIPVEYHGLDAAPSLIAIGRQELPAYGLPAERLQVMRMEDLDGEVEHVLCMNVLSNIDNYHRPLERMLKMAHKTVILRESVKDTAEYYYVKDKFLDDDVDLKVYVNTYPLDEFMSFIESYGFSVRCEVDNRTQGKPEMVIDYPHYWKFFVAVRVSS